MGVWTMPLHVAQCSAITVLWFLLILNEGPHFHFVLGSVNYTTSPALWILPWKYFRSLILKLNIFKFIEQLKSNMNFFEFNSSSFLPLFPPAVFFFSAIFSPLLLIVSFLLFILFDVLSIPHFPQVAFLYCLFSLFSHLPSSSVSSLSKIDFRNVMWWNNNKS